MYDAAIKLQYLTPRKFEIVEYGCKGFFEIDIVTNDKYDAVYITIIYILSRVR